MRWPAGRMRENKHRRLGDAARDRREWPVAATHYRAHLNQPGREQDAPIWVQLGHAEKESGRLDAALPAYRKAVALTPEIADCHLQLAHCLKLMGQASEALEAYNEALRIDPLAGTARQDRDDLARQLAASMGVPAQTPGGPLPAADAARDAGDWRQAATLYREYLSDPEHAKDGPIWIQLGHAQKESGYNDEALRSYRRAIALMPRDGDAYLQLGHLLKIMGASAEAYAAYQRAVEVSPGLADAEQELARLEPQLAGAASLARDQTQKPAEDDVHYDVAFPALPMGLGAKFED